jgi:hypothetical protein
VCIKDPVNPGDSNESFKGPRVCVCVYKKCVCVILRVATKPVCVCKLRRTPCVCIKDPVNPGDSNERFKRSRVCVCVCVWRKVCVYVCVLLWARQIL